MTKSKRQAAKQQNGIRQQRGTPSLPCLWLLLVLACWRTIYIVYIFSSSTWHFCMSLYILCSLNLFSVSFIVSSLSHVSSLSCAWHGTWLGLFTYMVDKAFFIILAAWLACLAFSCALCLIFCTHALLALRRLAIVCCGHAGLTIYSIMHVSMPMAWFWENGLGKQAGVKKKIGLVRQAGRGCGRDGEGSVVVGSGWVAGSAAAVQAMKNSSAVQNMPVAKQPSTCQAWTGPSTLWKAWVTWFQAACNSMACKTYYDCMVFANR